MRSVVLWYTCLVSAVLVLLSVAGCTAGRKAAGRPPIPAFLDGEAEEDGEEPSGRGRRFRSRPELRMVEFLYDSAAVSDDALQTLAENARWLREHPAEVVQVAGHCDERGSTEYNLALGQRRAQNVRIAYLRLGVAGHRITTISYGEEFPLDPGHSEASWARNRRAETLVRIQENEGGRP